MLRDAFSEKQTHTETDLLVCMYTRTHTHLTAVVRDYVGKSVPVR